MIHALYIQMKLTIQ
uniref:Uncharacterized protein n=1 Tax=Anguilla anguilla TaxID=7936 RepID=A0A0E9XXW8_ANGAN